MGLLDKLWDDTVAGPRPDTGLGRLRKHAARPAAVKINDAAGDVAMVVPPTTPAAGEETPVRVTRSIMIKRPAGCPASPRSAASTPPASPAWSTPPISPFAGAVLQLGMKHVDGSEKSARSKLHVSLFHVKDSRISSEVQLGEVGMVAASEGNHCRTHMRGLHRGHPATLLPLNCEPCAVLTLLFGPWPASTHTKAEEKTYEEGNGEKLSEGCPYLYCDIM